MSVVLKEHQNTCLSDAAFCSDKSPCVVCRHEKWPFDITSPRQARQTDEDGHDDKLLFLLTSPRQARQTDEDGYDDKLLFPLSSSRQARRTEQCEELIQRQDKPNSL